MKSVVKQRADQTVGGLEELLVLRKAKMAGEKNGPKLLFWVGRPFSVPVLIRESLYQNKIFRHCETFQHSKVKCPRKPNVLGFLNISKYPNVLR